LYTVVTVGPNVRLVQRRGYLSRIGFAAAHACGTMNKREESTGYSACPQGPNG
jgi:hypothetical protein